VTDDVKPSFTIAIDGPAAAGKGTLSRRIAEVYGFHHLDTGLTYRATAKALLDAGLPLDDESVAEGVARTLDLAGLDRNVLSRHEIGGLQSGCHARRAPRSGGGAAPVCPENARHGD
jgi:CMP/dCMP kinase